MHVCFIFTQYDHQRISMLANRLVHNIMSAIPDVIMNGDPEERYPGTHTHRNETYISLKVSKSL